MQTEIQATQTANANMESALLFGHSADWWNALMLISLVAAALVAGFVAAATSGAVIAAKRETAAAQDALERYKSTADGKIADAKREGIAAGKAAGEAEARASKVEEAAKWRVLNPETKDALAVALASGNGGSVALAWPANDSEALFLTIQLQSVFEEANKKAGRALWTVQFSPRVFSSAIFWSLRITGQSEAIVGELRTAFANAKIPYSDEAIPNVINDSPGMVIGGGGIPPALIWVGPKRPPN